MLLTTAESTANAPISITLTVGQNAANLYCVYYSYVGGTVTGTLTITEDGTTVFKEQTAATGPRTVAFPPYRFKRAKDVVITLAAGGASVIGNLTTISALE